MKNKMSLSDFVREQLVLQRITPAWMRQNGLTHVKSAREFIPPHSTRLLLGKHDHLAVTYPDGRWVLLLQHSPGHYEYFDPCSSSPQGGGQALETNSIAFCSSPTAAIGGKWVMLRFVFRAMTLHQFEHCFSKPRYTLTPDEMVALIV